MKQVSVGKFRECTDLGQYGSISPVRPRFSGHLRASADLCRQFALTSMVYRLTCICLHLRTCADI